MTQKAPFTVKINPAKENLITEFGRGKLEDGYLAKGETTAQEAFARVASHLGDNQAHAQRLYDYMSDLWFIPATPILSNIGRGTGLGISCFLSYVDDSVEGITDHIKEASILSVIGGGVGAHWSDLRSRGEATSKGNYTTGAMGWMTMADKIPVAASQGATRRGAYASFLDVSHPEIEQFLETRNPTGGDQNLKCLNIHIGINITDAFVNAVIQGNPWPLIDPHTKQEKKKVDARSLWLEILKTRMKTGEPYLHFIDRSNEFLPEQLKDKGLKVNGSNICVEITLPTSPDRTAVCCLSSVNLEKYDEWKDNERFIEDIMRMLDNNLTHFIDNAPPSLHRAINSAFSERSVGLGTFGFHGYLMSKGIPFESAMAKSKNLEIYKLINDKAHAANVKLAGERGPAPDMAPVQYRFSHMIAIAPNASSATICGEATPSIEPMAGNVFKQQTKAGTYIVVNKYLEKLLRVKYEMSDYDYDSTLLDIAQNEGSVQHLEWMDQHDKDVFKTAIEIDQTWLIEHAADRQPFICQAQSLNLFFEPDVDINYLSRTHLMAWKKGLKTLYYLRSRAINRPKNVFEKVVDKVRDFVQDEEGCLACSA